MNGIYNQTTSITIQTEARAEVKISRSTIAHLKAGQEQLINAKKSMLDDFSKGQFSSQQDVFNAIMELQDIQKSLSDFTDIVSKKSAKDFTASDVETMKAMKNDSATETMIANRFDTNQTKINRFLNNKISLND